MYERQAKTPELLKLADAKAETCGAKAAACAALERSAGSQYLTPKGAVFPFGTMDLAIQVPEAVVPRSLP